MSLPRLHGALFVALVTATACADSGPREGYDAPRGADQVLSEFTTQLSTEGRRSLSVEGAEAFVYIDSAVVWMLDLNATAYAEDGFPASLLQGDSARLDQTLQDITVWGSVVVQSESGGFRLETAEVRFEAATGRFLSDSTVLFRRAGGTQEGTCFESDVTLSNARICG